MMGQETLFPGANDNASGTAMLIDLARHYSLPENHHDYSLAFMAFSAEESGLLGSKHYTEKPYFPLTQIKFLINLDMVGTGSDGLLVFNGTTDSVRLETMQAINERNQYLKELRVRGESRSSDHYYFHQKGVPAFFLLTMGSEHRHYHNIYDTREAVPLTKYNEVFRLITDFFDTF
jgi:Zn-dependent M28 family amino/carboxypeptidase